MDIWIVYAKGPDWQNVEAFLTAEAACAYLAAELDDPGTSGQIKTVRWEHLPETADTE